MRLRLAVLLALAAAPALAQTLPSESAAERAVRSNNQAIQQLQRSQARDAQTQFEVNQLRGEIQRNRTTPSLTGPGAGSGCPVGSVGC